MFETAIKYKIKLTSNYVLIAKASVTLEGLGVKYNPNIKWIEQTKAILKKIARKRYAHKRIFKKYVNTALNYKQLVEEFPKDVIEILDNLKKGKLKIDIEDKDIKSLSAELEQSSGNLSIGLITAAIIIASAYVMQIQNQFYINGLPVIPTVCFVVAVFLSIWLLQRTIFSKVVKKLRGE